MQPAIDNIRSLSAIPRELLAVLAKRQKALGNLTRLRIIAALADAGGAMSNSDLLAKLGDVTPAVLSKHLKELRTAGLVTYAQRATDVTVEVNHVKILEWFLRVAINSCGDQPA